MLFWLKQCRGDRDPPSLPAVLAETPSQCPGHHLKSLIQVNPVSAAKIKHKTIFFSHNIGPYESFIM